MDEGRTKRRGASSTQGTRGIVCPFFHSHNGLEINCEGYTDDMVCTMKFRQKSTKKTQQTIYCENNYKYCEHYITLMMLKYQE